VSKCLEVDAGVAGLSGTRDEHHTRDVALSARREHFLGNQLREEEWPYVVRLNLTLEVVHSEFEEADWRCGIVDYNLEMAMGLCGGK
jgi:hypothetical protein